MCGTLTPYMAVANDARSATTVNTPRTELTAAGCENEAPFLITAWKQPICVCVALENMRREADPSKSGMTRAMLMMSCTSWAETGITAPPVIGTLALSGHRLTVLTL